MYCDMCGALKRDFCICKNNLYKNIKVRKVSYGFGYVMEGDVSTLTIDNVLTNLDYQFKELKGQLKETQGEIEKLKSQLEIAKEALDYYTKNPSAIANDYARRDDWYAIKARQTLEKINELNNNNAQ